jgi:DNA-binding transcriptional LysR family regulator
MDRFSAISALIAVVESGSFQAAGERLGIAKSVVSRRVSQLEQSLGIRLLHRTTRSHSLTDEGLQFYRRSVQIMNDLQDAELEASQDSGEVRGRMRLAAPLSFGLLHLSRAINEFLQNHPALDLELDLNDRNVNLVEEGFDMAVRIGELEDSQLIARRIGTSNNITCASPSYIEQKGQPVVPDDLRHHAGLQYTNVSRRAQWQYGSASSALEYGQPKIRMRANNGEVLASAAISGTGIVSGPSFILGQHVRSGQLRQVMTGYRQPPVGIYVVYPPGRLLPRRVQVFSDFLKASVGEHPQWDEGLQLQV